MLLQHPTQPTKRVLVRKNSPELADLLDQGYRDITPPRTPAQVTATAKFNNLGNITACMALLNKIIPQVSDDMEATMHLELSVTILREIYTKVREGG